MVWFHKCNRVGLLIKTRMDLLDFWMVMLIINLTRCFCDSSDSIGLKAADVYNKKSMISHTSHIVSNEEQVNKWISN